MPRRPSHRLLLPAPRVRAQAGRSSGRVPRGARSPSGRGTPNRCLRLRMTWRVVIEPRERDGFPHCRESRGERKPPRLLIGRAGALSQPRAGDGRQGGVNPVQTIFPLIPRALPLHLPPPALNYARGAHVVTPAGFPTTGQSTGRYPAQLCRYTKRTQSRFRTLNRAKPAPFPAPS